MPKVIAIREEEEAISELVALLDGRRFVRVDGHSGHGKSRVAKALAASLGWRRLELDEFLDGKPRDRRTYCQMIDDGRLRAALSTARSEGIVLDGICLDQIVSPGTYGPELRVYVRSYFLPEHDEDERRRRAKLGTDQYHREYDPAPKADALVLKLAL